MAFLDLFKSKSVPDYQLSDHHKSVVAKQVQKDFSQGSGGFGGIFQAFNNTGQLVSEWTALESSTVYACVRLISDTISKLPIKCKGPDNQTLTKHPIVRLLKKPNYMQTYIPFMLMVIANLELTGNSVVYIDRDEEGDPVRLVPIQPGSVAWSYSDNGLPFYSLFHPMLHTRTLVPFTDVIHLKNFAINHGYEGKSLIAAAQNVIGISLAQNKVVGGFYEHGSISSGVVNVEDDVSTESLSKLAGSFQQTYSGADSANKVIFLPNGVTFTPINMNYKDAQLLESRLFQVTEIARDFGVPLSKLAYGDAKDVSNFEQENLAFIEDCIMARCKKIAEEFSDKLLSAVEKDQDVSLEFDFGELNKTDKKTQIDVWQLEKLNALKNTNEIRNDMGLPPIDEEWANQYNRPLNIGNAADQPLPATQINPNGGHNSNSDRMG
jgi:HK97 family phage portal protein